MPNLNQLRTDLEAATAEVAQLKDEIYQIENEDSQWAVGTIFVTKSFRGPAPLYIIRVSSVHSNAVRKGSKPVAGPCWFSLYSDGSGSTMATLEEAREWYGELRPFHDPGIGVVDYDRSSGTVTARAATAPTDAFAALGAGSA